MRTDVTWRTPCALGCWTAHARHVTASWHSFAMQMMADVVLPPAPNPGVRVDGEAGGLGGQCSHRCVGVPLLSLACLPHPCVFDVLTMTWRRVGASQECKHPHSIPPPSSPAPRALPPSPPLMGMQRAGPASCRRTFLIEARPRRRCSA